MGQRGEGYVGLEWWCTIRSGRHHHGRCRKDLSEKFFFGRIAFSEHGGKTGMAMIKYPHTRKNALPRFTSCTQVVKYISTCTITSSPSSTASTAGSVAVWNATSGSSHAPHSHAICVGYSSLTPVFRPHVFPVLSTRHTPISTSMGSIYFWIIVIAIAAWLGIYVW